MDAMSTTQSERSKIVQLGRRIELFCDLFDTGEQITSAVADASEANTSLAEKIVILYLSAEVTEQSIRAVIDAMGNLNIRDTNAIVAVEVPVEADGTDAFRAESSPVKKALAVTDKLNKLEISWVVTLSEESVWCLDSVFALARDNKIRTIVKHGCESMSDHAQLFAWDFVTYHLLDEARHYYGPNAVAYFSALKEALVENSLGSKQDRLTLVETLDEQLTDALSEPVVDRSGKTSISANDVLEMAAHLARAHLKAFRQSPLENALPDQLHNALLVGAYGGEHIGDMAILGGVLFRLHREFGLTKAVLLTQRPNHTRHLVGMLETPVSVTVAEYTFAEIDKQMASCDALIHAGGPLTDIPKQLVRHLYAAGISRRSGKPYLIEGIGPTTFKRAVSRITARRLVKLADRIVVRTKQDAAASIIQDLDISIGRDPAFDYLETLDTQLDGYLPGELEDLSELLEGTGGRPIIGINIRPINDLFAPAKGGVNRASLTQAVEERMELKLAHGIEQFAKQSKVKPVFIFFPMNAIQFGKSDNRSAYRISRHLSPDTDARFWQKDASLNAVVKLIRGLDTVISMRFHATIFALSQSCPPVGIDYRIGMKYKVSAVMDDAGHAEFCCRIDEVEGHWIAERIAERLAARNNIRELHLS